MADPKNTIYSNFVLENEIEELVASRLDLQPFVTIDNALEGQPGMQIKVNTYTATDGTEVLAMGEGNTKSIVASYTPATYDIKTAQNKFEYFDEELYTDPTAIETGIQKQAAGLFDKMNADVYGEWIKTSQTADGSTSIYDGLVDAQALINEEGDNPAEMTFAIIHPKDLASVRKELKDTLQYVEAFARDGYVGTVAGMNLYAKKNATEKTIVVARPEAVKLFVKQGTEVENVGKDNRSETAANIRLNTIFARKYYVAALVDETKAVRVTLTAG